MNTAIFNNFIVIPFLKYVQKSAKLYHNSNQCRKITGKKMNDSPIIAIVGFGSLGALFASLLAPNMPFENLRIVADTDPCQPLPTARFIGEWRAINTQLCHPQRHHHARRLGHRLYQILSTQ